MVEEQRGWSEAGKRTRDACKRPVSVLSRPVGTSVGDAPNHGYCRVTPPRQLHLLTLLYLPFRKQVNIGGKGLLFRYQGMILRAFSAVTTAE
jgi:hypothetical protein